MGIHNQNWFAVVGIYLVILVSLSSSYAQDTTRSFNPIDRMYTSSGYGRYDFIQGGFTNMYSNPFIGLNLKHARVDGEGMIAVLSGYSIGLDYGSFDSNKSFNANTEAFFQVFPYTLIFKLGIGLNSLFDFNQNHLISAYPLLSIDIGGFDISYQYNIKVANSFDQEVKPHSLRLRFGLWFNYREINYSFANPRTLPYFANSAHF